MAKYVCKRVGYAILTIFLISVITFTLMNLIPGGPFLSEKAVTPATQAALEAKYGLDVPKPQQYLNYMNGLLHGDFGESLKQKGRTANDIIFSTFPVSARLGGISILVALVAGVGLGSVAAMCRGKWGDQLIMVVSTLGIAVPSFVVATALMKIFGVELKWLPTMGLSTPLHYILPVFTLAFYPMAYITRLMRSSMLDALNQDYIRTARAKGVSKFKMLFKHALRNAILPIITYAGPLLAFTLSGSFVVEKIFNIPGLGREFINCITGRDYPMVMSTTIFLATFLVLMNVIVDILYKIVDPRIKLR
ncbi:MAG TPA: ABC transporter permease [Candidatus Anaeromassilibacillus stercoravium]|nr:ABC transporter permease [Candidatus Anaeromassilibacillus stercoravium]